VVLAAERLDDVPTEQRGWEWRYLKQQTRGGLFNLYGHAGEVTSAAFSPDGTRIVSGGSQDRMAKVWDARTGRLLLEFKGHSAPVTSAAFSPDGSRIVTGSGIASGSPNDPGDGDAKVWDARTGRPCSS
jgi:WD40 repeat protein